MQIYYTLKAMNIWSRGQVVKTPPFHGGIRGSSPLEITKKTALLLVFEQAFRSPKNALRIFWNKEETNEW